MKLIIKTDDQHIKDELITVCEQVLVEKDTVLIADNFIDNISIHHSYITINFQTRKYIYSGITSFGINRAMIKSIEVL